MWSLCSGRTCESYLVDIFSATSIFPSVVLGELLKEKGIREVAVPELDPLASREPQYGNLFGSLNPKERKSGNVTTRGRPCRQPYPRRGPRVDLSGLQSFFSPTNFTDFQMPPYHARSRTRTARVFFSPMRTASPRAISKRLSHPQSLRSCSPISTPLR